MTHREVKEDDLLSQIDLAKVPSHVAIIMDGNGRWAEQRSFGRIRGHRAGVEAIRNVTEISMRLKIPFLTFYAFSSENWLRPESEVSALWELMNEFLKKEVQNLKIQSIKLKAIGDISKIPPKALASLNDALKETAQGDKLTLTLALNYGSREEILRAVNLIKNEETLKNQTITQEIFKNYLYTHDVPDPDLLIRTSGEIRLSNYLLWQLSYAEMYFTSVLWPDFSKQDYLNALLTFQNRKRRFGGV